MGIYDVPGMTFNGTDSPSPTKYGTRFKNSEIFWKPIPMTLVALRLKVEELAERVKIESLCYGA